MAIEPLIEPADAARKDSEADRASLIEPAGSAG
jgi:hypothetical protein